MRKRYKQKSNSLCKMCKDYKVGWDKRWTGKELDALERFEKQRGSCTGHCAYSTCDCNDDLPISQYTGYPYDPSWGIQIP